MNATATQALLDAPAGTVLAGVNTSIYGSPSGLVAMNPGTVGNVGGSQAHPNMQPFRLLILHCAQAYSPARTKEINVNPYVAR